MNVNGFRETAVGVAVCEADAVSNAIGYAKFFSRSHDAVIRVYDESGNAIETDEAARDFVGPRVQREHQLLAPVNGVLPALAIPSISVRPNCPVLVASRTQKSDK